MMARRLIEMVHCGGPVSQICTGCGHVFSELTMPLRHRGRNEDVSPPDFDGGRLGNYSGQRSQSFIMRVERAARARSTLMRSGRNHRRCHLLNRHQAETPCGRYQGVTDQVVLSETPGFFAVPLVPRGASRAEWLAR